MANNKSQAASTASAATSKPTESPESESQSTTSTATASAAPSSSNPIADFLAGNAREGIAQDFGMEEVPALRVRSCSPQGSFRRAGFEFGREPTEIPLSELTADQRKALKDEALLIVDEVRMLVPRWRAAGQERKT